MSFRVPMRIAPMIQDLASILRPFSNAQGVSLEFILPERDVERFFDPSSTLPSVLSFVSKVIMFTPQGKKVDLLLIDELDKWGDLVLVVRSSGADLRKIGEIVQEAKGRLEMEFNGVDTQFQMSLGTSFDHSGRQKITANNRLPKQYPQAYQSISRRLLSHFAGIKNLESAVMERDINEGVFLKKLNSIINAHLQDEDFGVRELASAMALSRAQLFRKLKALSQMAPREYISQVRLEKARELLQSNHNLMNVSEVCYAVGYASRSHFTRTFQRKFGLRPSECLNMRNATPVQKSAT